MSVPFVFWFTPFITEGSGWHFFCFLLVFLLSFFAGVAFSATWCTYHLFNGLKRGCLACFFCWLGVSGVRGSTKKKERKVLGGAGGLFVFMVLSFFLSWLGWLGGWFCIRSVWGGSAAGWEGFLHADLAGSCVYRLMTVYVVFLFGGRRYYVSIWRFDQPLRFCFYLLVSLAATATYV